MRPAPIRPALLLAAHGTRDQAGVAAFNALAERVGGLAAGNGTPANMVAVPLMLSAAGHAKGDIPAALARERTRHPGLSWTYARPLGPHPALLDLQAARIAAAQGGSGGMGPSQGGSGGMGPPRRRSG